MSSKCPTTRFLWVLTHSLFTVLNKGVQLVFHFLFFYNPFPKKGTRSPETRPRPASKQEGWCDPALYGDWDRKWEKKGWLKSASMHGSPSFLPFEEGIVRVVACHHTFHHRFYRYCLSLHVSGFALAHSCGLMCSAFPVSLHPFPCNHLYTIYTLSLCMFNGPSMYN